jgi:hypothetical protein
MLYYVEDSPFHFLVTLRLSCGMWIHKICLYNRLFMQVCKLCTAANGGRLGTSFSADKLDRMNDDISFQGYKNSTEQILEVTANQLRLTSIYIKY